jgi:hypothetical protein
LVTVGAVAVAVAVMFVGSANAADRLDAHDRALVRVLARQDWPIPSPNGSTSVAYLKARLAPCTDIDPVIRRDPASDEDLFNATVPPVTAHFAFTKKKELASLTRRLRSMRPHHATFRSYVNAFRQVVTEMSLLGRREPPTAYCRVAAIVATEPLDPVEFLAAGGPEVYYGFRRLNAKFRDADPARLRFRQLLLRSGLRKAAASITGSA